MSIFRMPSLGADMEDGTLTEWMVAPGARVARGDIVAVVETQKGAIEIEIFEEGEIIALLATVGETLLVGAPLAEIRVDGEASAAEDAPETQPSPARPTAEPPPEPPAIRPEAGARPPASPAARRLAREIGVDLADLTGTGPAGAIVLADVEAARTEKAAPKKPASGFDPSGMRAAVAVAMSRSKREIPHYYLSHEIDLQPVTDWLAATNAERPPERRLAIGLLLVRAVALAARRVPEINGFWRDGAFEPASAVHAGLVISLRGGGLVAPALHDADDRPLDDLMEAMRDLVSRARAGRLRSSEMTDPTLTVSSLGERGVDALYGVIFPPQVAIVGFGSPRLKPLIVEGDVRPRMAVTATLSADHRASDGRRGARALAEIAALLQKPEAL